MHKKRVVKRTQVSIFESRAVKGGCGSGLGIVSYGALRCESVTEL